MSSWTLSPSFRRPDARSRAGARPWLYAAATIAIALGSGRARGNDVELAVTQRVPSGQRPALTVKVNKDLRTCTLELAGGAGRHRETRGPAVAGTDIVFTLPHDKAGQVKWQGSLAVTFADDSSGSMPLAFSTDVLSPFRFEVRDIRLDERRFTVVSERDTAKVELEVFGDDGEHLAASGVPLDAVPAHTPIPLGWTPRKDGTVLRIHVVVHDTSGAFQSTDLFPYNIAIPHEEVEFETGRHDIRPGEEQKLEAALAELARAVQRYSAAVKVEGVTIRLFVAGHTDTVGPASSNRALSERRARAIASWFLMRGVLVPVFARGFGEDALKVQTPDDTDEQRNRRVDYDVGVNGPTGSIAGWALVR